MSEKKMERWVYLGMVNGSKGERLYAWAVVPNGPFLNQLPVLAEDATTRLFSKRLARCAPGSVFKFEVSHEEEKAIVHGDGTYEGPWFHREQVISWSARSRAVDAEISARAKQKRDMNQDQLLDALQPIQLAYRRMKNRRQRAHLLAQIIEYITGLNT